MGRHSQVSCFGIDKCQAPPVVETVSATQSGSRDSILKTPQLTLIVQNHIKQRFMNSDATVVFNEASLRKRFMKKLTRDREVPIISAKVSWVIGGINGSGSPGLPTPPATKEFSPNAFRWS
jgi:hypothetical protein